MKSAMTIADIGNVIEACEIAIENARCLIDSNTMSGPKGKKYRKTWSQEDRDNYDEWSEQIERFRQLRKKLLAIEKAA
jgi:hypothetical protein